ncbi:MAG TPA: hypothetical protein VIG86_04815 [Candidatus Dormibacteraeota bacterium]
MTLAAHANAALRAGSAMALPAHPAFMVVRRARLRDGGSTADLAAWFDRIGAGSGPVLLAAAGVDGEPLLCDPTAGWRVIEPRGVFLEPASRATVEPMTTADATSALRAAAAVALQAAAGAAPPLWSDAVHRAVAILASSGSGEELSDVAWPHFLLPPAAPMAAQRLAAAAATLWQWDGAGAWTGETADRAHAALRRPVDDALIAAVAATAAAAEPARPTGC